MKIKESNFQLNDELSDLISHTFNHVADPLAELVQRLKLFAQSTVQRGETIVTQYRTELKELRRTEGEYMPLDIQVSTNGKSTAHFRAHWIRTTWVDTWSGRQFMKQYQVSERKHTTNRFDLVLEHCPAPYRPLVAKTESELTQVRAQVHLTEEMLRLMARLVRLHAAQNDATRPLHFEAIDAPTAESQVTEPPSQAIAKKEAPKNVLLDWILSSL